MRLPLIIALLISACFSVSCDSTDTLLILADKRMQKYYETNDVRFLSESHHLYQQCETGKSRTKEISRRFMLYILFADYDGARDYLSKIKESEYPDYLNSDILRMEVELFEYYDNLAFRKVDSLVHQVLYKQAQLYEDTKNIFWLQELIGLYQECCDETEKLSDDFIQQSFLDCESLDIMCLIQQVEQVPFSIERPYQDIQRIREQIAGLENE